MLKETGYPVLAPSKIKAVGGKYRTLEGMPVCARTFICSETLTLLKGHTENITEIDDPKEIVKQFQHSVTLAKEAGFDGIELLSQGYELPSATLLLPF